MLTLTLVLLWLLTDESFRVTADGVRIAGLRLADETAVREHLSGLDRAPNVFRLRMSELVGELQELPQVRAASASAMLPANISLALEEREPLFTWSDGTQTWLVDREGMLFAPGSPIAIADLDLPMVEDARLTEQPPAEGSRLPAADVAVMRQLLALTPELLGSRAGSLQLRVDEHDGYVLASDRGWQAIFGHYTPTLQPPDVVPRQVQCLTWLLATDERQLERVRLAVSEDGCGTYTELRRSG
jgi:cell division septal protein FtsQ